MGRLDWQTEEEGPIAPASLDVAARTRPKWLGLVVVASLVTVMIIVGWQLAHQAELRDEAVKADVLAAFTIWRQAVARQDAELLETLLLDGGAKWTAAQHQLLETGRLLDRQDMGLILAGYPGQVLKVEPTVELAADWRSAELTFPISYQDNASEQRVNELPLEQSLYLAREGARWLLREPTESFWGVWRTEAGQLASVTYRVRDESIALRFLADLDAELSELCAEGETPAGCMLQTPLAVRLESDPSVLLKVIDEDRPAFLGRTFVLPSPTLLGRPLNEAAYRALYRGYAAPILRTYSASLASPISLPDQTVAMLCFSRHGRAPRLYSYDPAADFWRAQLSDRSFSFLAASEDDESVALRQRIRGQPSRLRLLQWSKEGFALTHDTTYGLMTDHQLGWTGSHSQSRLLLATFEGTTRKPTYSLIPPALAAQPACQSSGCPSKELPGFPVWSPDGERSLLLIDGAIYRTDGEGQALVSLGEGLSPFWIDEWHYGFVRPVYIEQRAMTEVVVGKVGEDTLETLWRSDELQRDVTATSAQKPIFIQHVQAFGSDKPTLVLYGRQYAGDNSQHVFLSLPLSRGEGTRIESPVQMELAINQLPARVPSIADPNGTVPFVVSPNGRWLTVAHLAEKASDLWLIRVIEIGGPREYSYSAQYPGYSFSHPFFDWSSDDRWLLILDQDFMKLIAPALGFERIVAHDLQTCSNPAWINWNAVEAADR